LNLRAVPFPIKIYGVTPPPFSRGIHSIILTLVGGLLSTFEERSIADKNTLLKSIATTLKDLEPVFEQMHAACSLSVLRHQFNSPATFNLLLIRRINDG